MQTVLNTKVNIEVASKLEVFTKSTGRSKREVVETAIIEYLERSQRSQ